MAGGKKGKRLGTKERPTKGDARLSHAAAEGNAASTRHGADAHSLKTAAAKANAAAFQNQATTPCTTKQVVTPVA